MNVSHRRTAAVVAASLAALAPSAPQAYRVDASYPPQRVDPAPSARVATAAGAVLLPGGGIVAARRPRRSASRGGASP